MTCEHIRFDNLCGTECRITGASVSTDCGSITGEQCAPILAVDVREGRLALDDIQRPMNKAVRSVLIQLGALEPEPERLPLGKPRTYVARNRRGRRRGWLMSAEQKAKISETQRKRWARRKAAR